jgi:PAS domain-containing protein
LHGHEDWFLHKDGTFYPVLCSNAPIMADGKTTGAVLVVHDITVRRRVEEEQRNAEAELVQMEERLRLATEAAALGTWDFDLVTGALTWSERCKAIFGFAPEADITYELFLQTLHPDDRDRTDACCAGVHRARQQRQLRHRISSDMAQRLLALDCRARASVIQQRRWDTSCGAFRRHRA